MSEGVVISGSGAVSPAGWSASSLVEAILARKQFDPVREQPPGRPAALDVLPVPPAGEGKTTSHPRLRRVSPVTRFAVEAALEALGKPRMERVREGGIRLGIITTVVNACVTYTHRFYEEVINDPAVASPILFPETVFNSPASHIAAVLESTSVTYTLLGDSSRFLSGIDLAAMWLLDGWVDGCLVVACEELDWLSTEATQLFRGNAAPISEGAGALYLERGDLGGQVELAQVTPAFRYSRRQPRRAAGEAMWECLQPRESMEQSVIIRDVAVSGEEGISLRPTVGLSQVTTAWQAVLGHQLLTTRHYQHALIPALGFDEQAIGARFSRSRA